MVTKRVAPLSAAVWPPGLGVGRISGRPRTRPVSGRGNQKQLRRTGMSAPHESQEQQRRARAPGPHTRV